jgi:hypothetical protein
LVLLGNYPETVELAILLEDPRWPGRLADEGGAGLGRFRAEVSRRLGIDYEPYGARDPLQHWVDVQRLTRAPAMSGQLPHSTSNGVGLPAREAGRPA